MIREMRCKCGAMLAVERRADGQYDVFHPLPICRLVLGLQASGAIEHVSPARLDREAGAIVFDETGAN